MGDETITVGAVAEVRVGRHNVVVEVVEVLGHGWRVRSRASGKVFEVGRFERIIHEAEPENPAPECRPPKKRSLFESVILYFRSQPRGRMMNTRQMVSGAVAFGFWEHSGAKTPEQTLYSAIFREIATREVPRIVKAEIRGKFKLNPEAFPAEPEPGSEEQ